MRLHIFCSTFFCRLHLRLDCGIRRSAGELAPQLPHDRLRKLGLDREDVLQITRLIFRPGLLAGIGAGEPGRDPHAVAGLAYTSLDQMRDTKLLSNFLRRRVFPLE